MPDLWTTPPIAILLRAHTSRRQYSQAQSGNTPRHNQKSEYIIARRCKEEERSTRVSLAKGVCWRWGIVRQWSTLGQRAIHQSDGWFDFLRAVRQGTRVQGATGREDEGAMVRMGSRGARGRGGEVTRDRGMRREGGGGRQDERESDGRVEGRGGDGVEGVMVGRGST